MVISPNLTILASPFKRQLQNTVAGSGPVLQSALPGSAPGLSELPTLSLTYVTSYDNSNESSSEPSGVRQCWLACKQKKCTGTVRWTKADFHTALFTEPHYTITCIWFLAYFLCLYYVPLYSATVQEDLVWGETCENYEDMLTYMTMQTEAIKTNCQVLSRSQPFNLQVTPSGIVISSHSKCTVCMYVCISNRVYVNLSFVSTIWLALIAFKLCRKYTVKIKLHVQTDKENFDDLTRSDCHPVIAVINIVNIKFSGS